MKKRNYCLMFYFLFVVCIVFIVVIIIIIIVFVVKYNDAVNAYVLTVLSA